MKKLILGFVLAIFTFTFLFGCSTDFDSSAKITVYTRDTTSGTRDGFFTAIGFSEAIASNEVLVEGYVEVEGNGDIINAVKNDIYGLGYISLSSLDNSNLKGLKFNGVEPTIDNVINGSYKMSRNFNYMVRTDFANQREEQIVAAFVAYMSTIEGKATIINNNGIVAINSNDPSWETIKSNHPIASQDNSDLTIRFGGSTSVERVAQALSAEFRVKCGNFVAEHNHTGSGDAFKRTQGSEKDGANKIEIGFSSRDFRLTTSEAGQQGSYGLICVDAIVAVVNPKNNTITGIETQTLKDVYIGVITNWKDLE